MNRWLKTLLLLALGILLVFAALRWAERMTVQELTRTARPDDAGAVCIVWKPRLISGGGSCVVEVRRRGPCHRLRPPRHAHDRA